MILVALIVFVAALVQRVVGFGGSLVAVPLLAASVGLRTAVPAFALITLITTLSNTLQLHRHATPGDLVPLAVPTMVGIPLGVWLLARIDGEIITRALGVLLVLYAGYSLLGAAIPPVRRRLWAYTAGFTSGVLTGAYNAGGPPVVVYATAQEWQADRFRANLQSFFLLSSLFVVALHGLAGHLTPTVWRYAWVALPALLLGQFIGARVCRYLDAALFRRLVLLFLLALGLQLLLRP